MSATPAIPHGRAVLAPMSGITDRSFRRICRETGASAVTTEMVNAEGLVRQNTTTLRQVFFDEAERPIAVQLFGSEPPLLAEAARIAAQFRPEGIDLNFGCPAEKVVARGMGAAVLKDLERFSRVVTAVVRAVDLPVTVKLRSGWDAQSIVAVEAARRAEQCGAAGVTLHPRTRDLQFDGRADWDLIRRVKAAVRIPVTGSGDIWRPGDARAMLTETGCDAVMIGRGALGNPWIFRAVNRLLADGDAGPAAAAAERLGVCRRHFRLLLQDRGDIFGLEIARRHIEWYLSGLPEWAAYEPVFLGAGDPDAMEAAFSALEEYLRTCPGTQTSTDTGLHQRPVFTAESPFDASEITTGLV